MPAPTEKSPVAAVRRRSRKPLKFALAIAGCFLVSLVIVSVAIRRPPPPPSAAEVNLEQAYAEISEAMKVVAAQTPGGASMSNAELLELTLRTGFRRLNDGWIFELIQLRAELAKRGNPNACAALWSGSSNPDLLLVYDSLPAEQKKAWAQIVKQAAFATIHNLPLQPAPRPEEIQASADRLLARMPPNEVAAIRTVVNDRDQAGADTSCAAARAFYESLERSMDEDSIILARAILFRRSVRDRDHR